MSQLKIPRDLVFLVELQCSWLFIIILKINLYSFYLKSVKRPFMLDIVFDIQLRISWAQISGPDSLGYNEEKGNLGPNIIA